MQKASGALNDDEINRGLEAKKNAGLEVSKYEMKARLVLTFLVLHFAVSACYESRRPVLYTLDFESGDLLSWHKRKLAGPHSAQIVTDPVRGGRYAVRFMLRRTDRLVSKGKRAELQMFAVGRHGHEYWYGFSIYIPSDWREDIKDEVVAQWNATRDRHLGESARRSPPLAIRIKRNKWFITCRWDSRALTPPGNTAPKRTLWRGEYRRGAWTDWVVHARWSYGADGLLEIWQNGRLIVTRRGPNTYNDVAGLRFKIGIYKPQWNNPENLSLVTVRVIYHDEVRIAGGNASYGDVAPGPLQRRAAHLRRRRAWPRIAVVGYPFSVISVGMKFFIVASWFYAIDLASIFPKLFPVKRQKTRQS